MKLSIIVPVYNVENYIEECLESLTTQTLDDIEIIIVDDGSTDSSIIKAKKMKDSRIRIISQKNGGLSEARNTGIREAKGDYLTFIDSDDFISMKSAYEDMYNLAIEEDSDIVVGNAMWYYSDEKKYPLARNMDYFNYSPMKAEDYFISCIKSKRLYVQVCFNIYKRSLLTDNNIEFMKGIYHEDEEFTPRVITKAKMVSIYNKEFYMYRQREGSIMNSKNPKRGLDVFDICLKLENVVSEINSEELKYLFRNYIATIALNQVYLYKFKEISEDIRLMISRNALTKKLRIKSNLLNLNINLYIVLERIIRKKNNVE